MYNSLTSVPELQFDKEEEYEALVNKILPLLQKKNFKDATILVRKADYVAGNQDLTRLESI